VYVGGNIPRRIGSLQHSMQLPSDADFKLEISQSFQDDEIASIANELQAFREGMIEAARSPPIRTRTVAKAERDPRMESSRRIRADRARGAHNPQRPANSMQTTAHRMATTADRSSALVSAMTAADDLHQRTDRVGGRPEELSSGISRQVVTGNRRQGLAGATESTWEGFGQQGEPHEAWWSNSRGRSLLETNLLAPDSRFAQRNDSHALADLTANSRRYRPHRLRPGGTA